MSQYSSIRSAESALPVESESYFTRVLHVDPEALAVPDHDLDLVAVLLAVRDDVVAFDALARQDLDHPSDQAAPQEGHGRLRTQVPGRLQRERAGADTLAARQADPHDVRYARHVDA